jgi:hypothetical protein
MLCKIWDFHRCYYAECGFLGNRNPVHIVQEIHYVSVTEPSWLMLCKIWGFHGDDYDECHFWNITPCGLCKIQEPIDSIIRVTTGGLGTTLAVTSSNRSNLMMELYVPPKSWFFQEPHGVTSQRTAFFTACLPFTTRLVQFDFEHIRY